MDYGSFKHDDHLMHGQMYREGPNSSMTKKNGFARRSKVTKQLSTRRRYSSYEGTVYGNMFDRNGEKRLAKSKVKDQNKIGDKTLPTIVSQTTVAKRQGVTHSYIYTMLNSKSRQKQAIMFKNVMAWIILSDVAFFVASTEPDSEKYNFVFYLEEGIVSCFFLAEYIVRLYTITESRKYGTLGPWKGRLSYMLSFHALIDAFATFPFFIELLVGSNLPKLTYLRFFRLMRILRTDPLGKAMDSLQRVLYYNREILYVAGVMAIGLIIFTAVLMYYLRPRGNGNETPWSIPTTMYYSTLMLTGQGGPEGDLPWYTKSIVLLTGLFSIGMFAIPASMLTWGFEAEAARVASKTRKRHLRRMAGESESSSSSSSSGIEDDNESYGASSSDEEYMKLIAGEEEGGDQEDNTLKETLNEILSKVSSKVEIDSTVNLVERMEKLESKVDQILKILQEE